MRIISILIMTISLLVSSFGYGAQSKKNKLSPETKGVIIGGTATGVGTTIGVTLVGITALFPAVIIGGGIGYLTVKGNKGLKKLRNKKK